MKVNVVKAAMSHVLRVAENARYDDLLEAFYQAERKLPPNAALRRALLRSWVISPYSEAAEAADGTLLMVWGFYPSGVNRWLVWAAGTTSVDDRRYRRLFIRESARVIMEKLKGLPIVYNEVWSENKRAIRWLEKVCGMEITGTAIHGGEVFYKFEIRGGNLMPNLLTERNEKICVQPRRD